jgi:aspartyl aminopeptidase
MSPFGFPAHYDVKSAVYSSPSYRDSRGEPTTAVVIKYQNEEIPSISAGGAESQVALAQLERVETDIREKAEQFEEREAVLRERFA